MFNIETKDEIDDLQWLKIGYFENSYQNQMVLRIDYNSLNDNNIKWAFNHNKLIPEVLSTHYKKYDNFQVV